MEEIIAKIEREKEFQKKKAEEFRSGIFRDEVIFARYDQAAKILDWVLGLLREETESGGGHDTDEEEG